MKREGFEGSVCFTLEESENETDLWSKIASTIRLLIQNGYDCEVYEDEVNIVVINYGYSARKAYGTPEIHWITPEEYEAVLDKRSEKEMEEAKWLLTSEGYSVTMPDEDEKDNSDNM